MERRSLKIVFHVFSVPCARGKGYDEAEPLRLTCRPLEKLGDYRLENEDPGVYREMDKEVPREWKDIPLPTYQAQAEAAVAAATRSKDTEKPEPAPRLYWVKELLEIHRTCVDVLLSMGIDPLKEYTEKKAETILQGVKAGDTRCKVCEKRCSSTQKLKNHIRRRHIGKTPYQCGVCQRYYGDSQSLKVHLKKHAEPGEEVKMFNCEHEGCSASYPTIGKLNEHNQKHEDIRCSFCNKTFAYNRTKAAHELESCPRRPGASKSSKKGEKVAGRR